jgi:hypothetical protein
MAAIPANFLPIVRRTCHRKETQKQGNPMLQISDIGNFCDDITAWFKIPVVFLKFI